MIEAVSNVTPMQLQKMCRKSLPEAAILRTNHSNMKSKEHKVYIYKQLH